MILRPYTRQHVLFIFLACCAIMGGTARAGTIFVKADASGANNGTSWQDAFICLQDALAGAVAGDEIWIAAGVYKPDQGQSETQGDRSASFELIAGLALYGGFAGDEETLGERAGLFDDTILSGDLAGDDLPDFVNREDNSQHVMSAQTDSTTPFIVDGFRITGGNATAAEYPDVNGAGGALVEHSTVEFRSCAFVDNLAIAPGALWLGPGPEGAPANVLGDCVFEGNMAVAEPPYAGSGGGGGVGCSGNIVFTDCAFVGNRAANGAGLYCSTEDQIVLDHCDFVNNVASNSEGQAHGGALYLREGSFVVRDCTFTGNGASVPAVDYNHGAGGALATYWQYELDVLVLRCTFAGNSATHDGGAVFNYNCAPWYVNCVFVNNTANGDEAFCGGGAVFNNMSANARLINCLFIGNAATGIHQDCGGGAVHSVIGSWPIISNCVFIDNSANSRGGGVLTMWDSTARVRNCILWGNTVAAASGELAQIDGNTDAENTIEYCCIEGWTGALGGIGNFGDDPLFVDPIGPDGLAGTGDEDLHLAPGSPCIDRGQNWRVAFDRPDIDNDGNTNERIPFDLDWEGRFFNDPNTPDNACDEAAPVDLGAYEVGGTGPQPCLCDLTGDRAVDLADLSCLLASYGAEHADPDFNPQCDLDCDGTVALADLAELLGHYGDVCP